jgi:hypothetical protein
MEKFVWLKVVLIEDCVLTALFTAGLILYVTSYSLDAIVVLHIFTVGAGVCALPLYVTADALTVALLKLYLFMINL